MTKTMINMIPPVAAPAPTTTAGITAGIVGNEVDNKADNIHQETGDETRQKGQPPLYRHPAHDKAGDKTDEHADEKREYAVAKDGKGERVLCRRVFCYLIGMIGGSVCQRDDDTLADAQHTGDNAGKQAIFQAIGRQPRRGDFLALVGYGRGCGKPGPCTLTRCGLPLHPDRAKNHRRVGGDARSCAVGATGNCFPSLA